MSVADASPSGTETPDPRRRRRRIAAAAVVVLVLTLGVVAAAALRDRTRDAARDASSAQPAGPGAVPVCGFPSLDRITDDGLDADERAVVSMAVPDVQTLENSRIRSFRIHDGAAYVLEFDYESTYTVTSYGLADGRLRESVQIPLDWEQGDESFSTDDFQVDDDGALYVLDTLQGRRDLLKVDADGTLAWSTTIPEGPDTTGSVLDLYGLVRWDDLRDEPVIGVHEGGGFHLVSTSGAYEGRVDDVEGDLVAQLPDGGLVTRDSRQSEGMRISTLTVTDADGSSVSRLGATRGPAVFGRSYQHWPSSMVGAAPAPEGDGLLLARNSVGIEWLGTDGVLRGLWPDSHVDPDQSLALAEGSPLHLVDGVYYFLAQSEAGFGLAAVPEDEMGRLLRSPVLYNAATDPELAQLGVGAGLVTDATYHYFADGEEPAVRASFDAMWADSGYRLRYQVRGDPRVHDPVATEPAVVDLPAPGGDVPLELPATRPGVYEVDAALVDADTGDAVAGTCLRYTVGAPGGAGPMADLAPGADWGGAQPVRGVQIADELAIGSHRWQLDFGAIVPDPGAAPSADALQWDSLPRGEAEEGEGPQDPFAELAAAARLARQTDIKLVLQLASGGDAERTAVEEGTWEGWVRLIVGEIHREVPEIVYWQPWNEPNNAGISGAAYAEDIAAPFARAARAVSPGVQIIGGNVLGIEPGWWAEAVAAGACRSMDVAGIHPYTGHNRTWEEEGFTRADSPLAELATALEPCGDLPVWDTESGWWSDGVANFWAQGASVARKLLWYRTQGIDEWTYFFSEGGFGEFSNSWSLIQFGQYVKPGGAAFAATARIVDGRAAEVVESGIPYVHAMRLAPVAQTEGVVDAGAQVLALWTDDLSTEVVLTVRGGGTVQLVDQYGATSDLAVPADGAVLPVTGAPLFVAAPAGSELGVAPGETFGPDLLAGAPVRASSTHPDATIENVTSGTANVTAPWRSDDLPDGSMDRSPWIEADLPSSVELNRIAVATPGIRCCTAGLRDYTVSVRTEDGSWVDVAEQKGQFFDRVALFEFPAVVATAVRVEIPMTVERGVPVLSANYTGVAGGAHPVFVPLRSTSEWIAAVSSISAWSPGG